jgi:hypothetical protein
MQEWESEGLGFFLTRQLSGIFEVEEWVFAASCE